MKSRTWIAEVARAICGAVLLLLLAFWSVLMVRVVAGLVSGGVDGARGNLHRMMLWSSASCQDPIVALSRGYERLLVLFLITCASCQVYAWLGKRLRTQS